MKKKKTFLLFFMLIIIIVNLIFVININKKNGYYIGKIESIDKKNEITTMKVYPTQRTRYFTNEIKSNHKIEYHDDITISGLRDINKKRKELYLGQLEESIENLKVGDSIIFKVSNYDKNNYKLEIDELAVDLTLK